MIDAVLARPHQLSNHKTVFAADESAAQIIDSFLSANIVLAEDWESLTPGAREKVLRRQSRSDILQQLVEHGLLTLYQSSRILAGTTFGLVLGSYRVLERIGAGGMAIVFKAEHIDLRHLVAIKVLPMQPGHDTRLESRFFSEMRVIAHLRHPNIVAATDAGRASNPDAAGPALRFLVMEYVPGQDLEEFIQNSGPLPASRACNLAHQIASALEETHKYNLVHRDIKPSNIMVTPEEQAKLLDFGLSRHFDKRLTTPGTVLGTIDFMAPEQARDASKVDIRADLYSLGGVLYWSLTGRLPFGDGGSPVENLARRVHQPPPSLPADLADCPRELNGVLAKFMATHPDQRYQTPREAMLAILPFVRASHSEYAGGLSPGSGAHRALRLQAPGTNRVLIVDDESGIRTFCRRVLTSQEMECDETPDAESAIKLVAENPYDLVLLDMNMPGMTGVEALGHLRDKSLAKNLKIIMFSGQASLDEMSQMLQSGADDYLSKPLSVTQFLNRVRAAVRLKAAQDSAIALNVQLSNLNVELQRDLAARDNDLKVARNLLVTGIARLIDQRDARGRSHANRVRHMCRALAEAAMKSQGFSGQIDPIFLDLLEAAAPLHDVGKITLPDHILLKGGTLTNEERILMQTHTTVASEILRDIPREQLNPATFMHMVVDVVRHHHERFDGSGYPDRLEGEAIPLAARIVAIVDVYDALRTRRFWKPALSHATAVQIITQSSEGQFDPRLIQVFKGIHRQFETIYQENPD